MRAGFEQILDLYTISISEVKIPIQKKRANHVSDLMLALQRLYCTPSLSNRVAEILRKGLKTKASSRKGPKGMSLWEIFVLGQLRLCLNLSYDEVMDLANHHYIIRGILGIEVSNGDRNYAKQYSKSTIYDNLILLTDECLEKINAVVLEMGHEVFGHNKKKDQALLLKTDSFVVESDTYFPTDYRHLYESGRKCNQLIHRLSVNYDMKGWRQWRDNLKKLKSAYRSFGRVTSAGGHNKKQREHSACEKLLEEGRKLSKKVSEFKLDFELNGNNNPEELLEVEWFSEMLDKHIDLLEKRVIKGETIPHDQKIFSIFQPYVEWINKGKRDVEIGKKVFVTTDQYHLMVDCMIVEHKQDSEAFAMVVERLQKRCVISSLSTDKGFSSKENKSHFKLVCPEGMLVMPKKGKKNKKEQVEESERLFIKRKNKHNAIESNINELEHRGLDRCPDRSKVAFKKYVGLSAIAYNLHKIGRKLSHDMAEAESAKEREKPPTRKAA